MATQTRGLLYIDILGTKNLWKTRGVSKGAGRVGLFANAIANGASSAAKDFGCELISGKIWTDSAGLLYSSIDQAILAGITICRDAFSRDYHDGDARVYLRGVSKRASDGALESAVSQDAAIPGLTRVRFSNEQIDATILENSGFRGMRLIGTRKDLQEDSVAIAMERFWKSSTQSGKPQVVGRLHGNLYPTLNLASKERFLDVLWPMGTQTGFRVTKNRFQARFAASKGDSEEKRQLRPMNALFGFTERVVYSSAPEN